jgi:hypothetical protein
MSTVHSDPEIRQWLLDAVPAPDPAGYRDFAAVLSRAGVEHVRQNGRRAGETVARVRSRRRRPLLVACAVLLVGALLVPLIAFATGHGWWFQRPGAVDPQSIQPVSGVPSVVATGEIDGRPWTVVAFLSPDPQPPWVTAPPKGRLVCYRVILGNLFNLPRGGGACAGLRGMPSLRAGVPRLWMVHNFPDYWELMAGAVASKVARVEVVELDRGRRTLTEVPLVSVPAVGGGIRFFALRNKAALSPTAEIESITAYSSDGKVLQRDRYPYASRLSPHGGG